MALEKLLIFGFALAVLSALATWSSTTGGEREIQKTGYMDEITKLKEKAE